MAVMAVSVVAVPTVWSGPTGRAEGFDKMTVVTVKKPVQVRDTLLEPGKYVFKLLDTAADRSTVQIFNGTETRIIDTIITIPTYRMVPPSKTILTFWETPPGTARALRDWYYPGDNYGWEFPYPKHPAVLTASLNAPPPSPVEAPKAAAAILPHEAPPVREQPTEVAAAAPAPAPAPQATAAPESQERPAMPKTASPYPAIGLAGFLMVVLYALMRWRRAMYLR
jgi:hypothetical protein